MIYIGGQKVLTNPPPAFKLINSGLQACIFAGEASGLASNQARIKKDQISPLFVFDPGSSNESHGSNTDQITNNYIICYSLFDPPNIRGPVSRAEEMEVFFFAQGENSPLPHS